MLFYLMILWIYTCWASYLVPQRPCGVFYATRRRFTEVQHITWFFASTLIWCHTNKQRHTAHTGTNRMTYAYKYILTPPVFCSQHLYVLHSMNNQKLTLQSSLISWLFKNHWLVEVIYHLIRSNKVKVVCVVKIKLFFMDWFYYILI